VFFDTKNEVYEALEKCREWLEKSDKHQYTPQQIQCTIQVFHRNTAQHDKEATIAEFRRLAMESSVRVIFATEALGVGVNIHDIRRVVQHGIPKDTTQLFFGSAVVEEVGMGRMVRSSC
jgi:superfamily II DNA/RNA helicase